MRVSYIPDPPDFKSEDDKAVLKRVKQRRGEKGLIALDRTLLHSPPVADGWYVQKRKTHSCYIEGSLTVLGIPSLVRFAQRLVYRSPFVKRRYAELLF